MLQKVGGTPPFAIAGRRVVVRGIVIPYVAGQTVKVSFYRDGRKVAVQTVCVLPIGNGAGQFHLGFTSHYSGLVQARAAHYATPQQARSAGAHAASASSTRTSAPAPRGRRCACCSRSSGTCTTPCR